MTIKKLHKKILGNKNKATLSKNLIKGKRKLSVDSKRINYPNCTTISASEFGLTSKYFSENGLSIIKKLSAAGFETYFVGGCIRDLILGVKPKDFDIATSAEPTQIKKIFGSKCRLIGRRFRLAHIYSKTSLIETSTFRAAAHAKSQNNNVYGTISEDAFRRDFTINSLYYDAKHNLIYDFTNGIADIKNKKIRFIGDTVERVTEDPCRLLRAVRFESKLGFTIDDKIIMAIADRKNLLLEQNKDRMFSELIKFFHSFYAVQSCQKLYSHNLLQLWFPQLVKQIDKINEIPSFIKVSLEESSSRYINNKSLNPSFLLSVFLWEQYKKKLEELRKKEILNLLHKQNCKKLNEHSLVIRIAFEVINDQKYTLKITNNLQQQIVKIWELQWFFENAKKIKHYQYLLANPRFRVAYDFLLLRSKTINLELQSLAKWWTDLQLVDAEQQLQQIKQRIKVLHANIN